MTRQARNHFDSYPKERDEAWDEQGLPRPDYEGCIRALNALSPDELKLRQARIDRATVELGLHFGAYPHDSGNAPNWQLDLFPRIIPADEWQRIASGVLQRAKAFNLYINDLYNEQDILRDRVVPCSVALGDPAFHRQFSGFNIPGGQHCLCGAVDLMRDTEGRWLVLENHLATPFGLSYVVQNRRMLAQAFPELFETMAVCPVADFTTRLLEALRAQSSLKRPRIALLTRGESSQAFFEESFLARHMGIALTRPGDLLVRNSHVYLKTIRGLEQVDVIYRRLESSSIDPVALPQSEFNGVPGLVNCARKGTVQIVNSLGTGVADNRAILRYSDRIISYYLREQPLLRTVETYHLGDRDQASHAMQQARDMVFKPIQDHRTMHHRFGGKAPSGRPADMLRLAKAHPDLFIAQPILHPTRLPRFDGEGFHGRSVFMRVFFLLGENPVVLPGGLTRQGISARQGNRRTVLAEGMKDTWIPLEAASHPAHHRTRTTAEPRRDFSISSRVAEALYWIGRYLDRAESTARQLNILEDIRWDRLPQGGRQSLWPLWRSVAAATGQKAIAARKTPPADTLRPAAQLLLDPAEPASILSSISAARANAETIRDFFNPETWQVLAELLIFLEEERTHKRLSHGRLVSLTERLVAEIARLWGTAERTLLHDDGWQFYRIGTFLERAIGTMTLTGDTLLRTLETFNIDTEEDTDLAALLQLLGSLDAYRREYSSRAYIDRVAHTLLQSPNNPSSLLFCLKHIGYSLGTLTISGENPAAKVLQTDVTALSDYLSKLPFDTLFPSPADLLDTGTRAKKSNLRRSGKEAAKAFKTLTEGLNNLHLRIEDAYFSHQDSFQPQRQMRLFGA